MKEMIDKYPDPDTLKDQVIRTQELIFDFTKRISKLRRDLLIFRQDLD